MPSVYETVAAILLAGMAIAAPQAGKRDKVAISSEYTPIPPYPFHHTHLLIPHS